MTPLRRRPANDFTRTGVPVSFVQVVCTPHIAPSSSAISPPARAAAWQQGIPGPALALQRAAPASRQTPRRTPFADATIRARGVSIVQEPHRAGPLSLNRCRLLRASGAQKERGTRRRDGHHVLRPKPTAKLCETACVPKVIPTSAEQGLDLNCHGVPGWRVLGREANSYFL